MPDPSESLVEFALFALDHAMESVVASGGPLVPFAVVETHGERQLSRFAGDLADGQRQAREAVRDSVGIERAAVAWDGYLTVEGERTDAVFVEASESGGAESVIMAQRYRVAGRLRKHVEPFGNAAIAGSGDPLY